MFSEQINMKVYTTVRVIRSSVNSDQKQLLEFLKFQFNLLLKVASVKRSDQLRLLSCLPHTILSTYKGGDYNFSPANLLQCLTVLIGKRRSFMSSQKGNKKSFYRCLHSTIYRKCGPGERNTQKTEVSQATEIIRKVCSKKDLPLVEENQL